MDGFDYSDLPASVAKRQMRRAERIQAMQRRAVETMAEIGRELCEAQAEFKQGPFQRWIKDGTGLSKSAAYRFMDVSKVFGSDLSVLGDLPPTVVQMLAARSTPAAFRASVLDRLSAGEALQPEDILTELRQVQPASS